MAAWIGGEFGGEWIHVYVWLNRFAVYLKLLYFHLICHSDPTEIERTLENVYSPLQAHQLVAPVTATVLNVVSLLEQISKASGTWYATRDLTNFFF